MFWPAEQPRAEDRRVQCETRARVGGVVAGQRTDSVQAVGDSSHREMQLCSRRGGDSSSVEICLERVEQRAGTATRLTQWIEDRVHQVDDGRLIAKQDSVDQQILCFDDRVVQPEAGGCGQPFASFLVGTRNSVRTRVCAANGHAPGRARPEAAELCVDELPKRGLRCMPGAGTRVEFLSAATSTTLARLGPVKASA